MQLKIIISKQYLSGEFAKYVIKYSIFSSSKEVFDRYIFQYLSELSLYIINSHAVEKLLNFRAKGTPFKSTCSLLIGTFSARSSNFVPRSVSY